MKSIFSRILVSNSHWHFLSLLIVKRTFFLGCGTVKTNKLNKFFTKVNSKQFSVSKMGVPLGDVLKKLQQIAPLKLAESWDNVGLLVEPNRNSIVNNILLTIDLTEDIVEEAVQTKSELIISYHPNIFKPLKQITERYSE